MKRAAALGIALSLGLVACETRGPVASGQTHTVSGATKKRRVVLEKGQASAALFSEELDGLRANVGAFLAKNDELALDVVPIAKVDALYALALSGRRREGGPVCAAPASTLAIVLASFPDALLAETSVSCGADEMCTLLVTLVDPPTPGSAGAFEHVRTWRARTTRLDLVRAPAKLVVDEGIDGEGFALDAPSGARTTDRARFIELEHVTGTGTWKTPPALADFANANDAAQSCHAPGMRSIGLNADVTLAIDASGAVTRCELRPHEDPSNREQTACLCRALGTARFAAGAADRRAALSVMDHPEVAVRTKGKRYLAAPWPRPNDADGGFVDRSEATLALSQCSAVVQAPIRFKASVDLDGTGRVTAAAAEGEPKAAHDCVVDALRKLRASCSKDGRPRRLPLFVGGAIEDEPESQ
jgi:hypothetical protein